jgi:hypothetical protein
VASYNDGATCTRIGGSLIAGNVGGDVSARFTAQGYHSLDYNVIGVAGDNVDFSEEFNQTHDQTNVTAPLLAPLADYGGPTLTHALLPGSPAIDAGAAGCTPTTDQRDFSRVGNCDVGAFESQGFVLDSLTGTPQSTVINTPFATPLGLTVTANEATEPVDGGLVTFTPPGSGASAALTGSPATIAGGLASVTAAANGTAGVYNVVASASGAAVVNFALTNEVACSNALTVTSDLDSGAGTLRQAIADVCAGGTITFNGDMTILLASELALDKDLTIDGETHAVTVSGNNVTRVFNVTAGNVTFDSLRIINHQPTGVASSMIDR